MNYKQLLILRLSGTIEWKSEAEMIIPKEMRKDFDYSHTCEFLGDGKYILRGYWENGNKHWEAEYQNGLLHGFNLGWYKNGRLHWKIKHQNGIFIKRCP